MVFCATPINLTTGKLLFLGCVGFVVNWHGKLQHKFFRGVWERRCLREDNIALLLLATEVSQTSSTLLTTCMNRMRQAKRRRLDYILKCRRRYHAKRLYGTLM